MNCRQYFKEGTQELGLNLAERQLDQFINYLNLLQKWNQQINLTAIEAEAEIIEKHFLDSLFLTAASSLSGTEKVIDIGTGGGFPGLPLKIVYPNLKLTLLEAVKKKVTFLQQVVYKLDLKGVEIIHGRAEDYGQRKGYREEYNYGLARAVAELNLLAEYCLPFVQQGGKFVAYKSAAVKSELEASQKAINTLNGSLESVFDYQLPFTGVERKLLTIKKIATTPENYPRQVGKPAKQPL